MYLIIGAILGMISTIYAKSTNPEIDDSGACTVGLLIGMLLWTIAWPIMLMLNIAIIIRGLN